MASPAKGPRPGLEELEPDECLRLLASVSVGRVGVTIDALPAVLPVNFVVSEGAVVFRTIPGTKLDSATTDAVVAFEVDAYGSADEPGGWSVLVRGVARELTDPTLLDSADVLALDSWAWDGQADRFIRIEPTLLTGRRVNRARRPTTAPPARGDGAE